MKPLADCKLVMITAPQAIVDDAAFGTAEVDTLGWDWATIIVLLGATDIAITVLQVTQANVSATSHAAISGTVFGTDNTDAGVLSVLPSATDDNKFFVFDLDLRGKMRYLDLNVTIGNGTVGGFVTAFCILSRGKDLPRTAAERGISQAMSA